MKKNTWVIVCATVLIVEVLHVAIAEFVRLRNTVSKSTCIFNLKALDGAKQQWAIENKKGAKDTPSWSDIAGPQLYIWQKPVCHEGGFYWLCSVGEDPRCSLLIHTLDEEVVKVSDKQGGRVPGSVAQLEVRDPGGYLQMIDPRGLRGFQTKYNLTGHQVQQAVEGLVVYAPGYETNRLDMPFFWPLTITLKKQEE